MSFSPLVTPENIYRTSSKDFDVYNFGYSGQLPVPSITIRPDSDLREMKGPCRDSIAIIGEKYSRRQNEIMRTLERIQKYTQALPVGRIRQTETHLERFNYNMPASTVSSLVRYINQSGDLSLVEIIEILCSDWLSSLMT